MSKLPVSIIIVGLGDSEFESMRVLDADQNVLTNDQGIPAVRDIVQFVNFKEFDELALTEVTEELLAEIPDQFVEFMVMKKIKPSEDADSKSANIKEALDNPLKMKQ